MKTKTAGLTFAPHLGMNPRLPWWRVRWQFVVVALVVGVAWWLAATMKESFPRGPFRVQQESAMTMRE